MVLENNMKMQFHSYNSIHLFKVIEYTETSIEIITPWTLI